MTRRAGARHRRARAPAPPVAPRRRDRARSSPSPDFRSAWRSAASDAATRSAARCSSPPSPAPSRRPWIVRAWQRFMRRPDDRGRRRRAARHPAHRRRDASWRTSRQALSSDAFSLAAFRDSGLVEPFESAGVHHILTGDAQGVPFAIAEIALLDAKGYRMFGGVTRELQARAAASRPDDRRPRSRPARQSRWRARQRDRAAAARGSRRSRACSKSTAPIRSAAGSS